MYTTLLPAEFVRSRAIGSFRWSVVDPFLMLNLYWAIPGITPTTSPDQSPLPSDERTWSVGFQKLKLPTTDTLVALGAHTRKVQPVP